MLPTRRAAKGLPKPRHPKQQQTAARAARAVPIPTPDDTKRSSDRATPKTASPATVGTPDLFGFVPPASVTAARNTRQKPAAEWPANGTGPAPLASPAPDRPPTIPPRSLTGTYARRGAVLTRPDGVTLHLRQSHKRNPGATDAPRTVYLGYPGGGKPAFLSGLYDRGGDPRDDLDGSAFEKGSGGSWYRITWAGPDTYRVSPTSRRRGRSRR